jgi:hypothetical protein
MSAFDLTERKKIFVILGTARSGTSVISRALKALGIDLGTHLTPANGWNPKGFWEDNDIVYQVNEKVLKNLGYSWDSIRLVDENLQLSSGLDDLKLLAIELLKQRFASTDYWGFKDPRTAKILTFWQSVFAAAQVKDNYVIALRNPLSSALSYQRLTRKDVEHGLLLWLMHLLASVDATWGKNRIVVSYDLLVQAPSLQLERIKQEFSIPSMGGADELVQYANSFVDKRLLHYEHNVSDLCRHPASAVAPVCGKLYELLLSIAKDETSFNTPTFLTIWDEIKKDFSTAVPMYTYMDTLIKRQTKLEKTLNTLHKSRLWKLIYPLRVVDEAFRQRRKQKKRS